MTTMDNSTVPPPYIPKHHAVFRCKVDNRMFKWPIIMLCIFDVVVFFMAPTILLGLISILWVSPPVSDSCALSPVSILQNNLYHRIALYRDDKETANNICKTISDNIIQWDDKIFQYWYGDKAEYLMRLMDFDSNRINLLNNVSLNLAEPKVRKLPHFSFL